MTQRGETAYMYCKKCESELPTGITYCPNCGAGNKYIVDSLKKKKREFKLFKLKKKEKINHEIKETTKKVSLKKYLKIVIPVLLVFSIVIVMLTFRGRIVAFFDEPETMVFYSEDSGIFTAKADSNITYRDLTNISLSEASLGYDFYVIDEVLYQFKPYRRDTVIAREVDDLFYPTVEDAKSAVYMSGGEYYLYMNQEVIEIDKHRKEDINVYYGVEDSVFLLKSSLDGERLSVFIDSEEVEVDSVGYESDIEYVDYIDGVLYYVRTNGNIRDLYAFESGQLKLIMSYDSRIAISTLESENLLMVNEVINGTTYLYEGTNLVNTYQEINAAIVFVMKERIYVNSDQGVKLLDTQFNLVDVSNFGGSFEYMNLFKISDDGLRFSAYNGEELEYHEQVGQEDVVVYHPINLTFTKVDDQVKYMYGFSQNTNDLLAIELSTGLVEEVAKGVVDYQLVGQGVFYIQGAESAVFYKARGQKVTQVISGRPEPRFTVTSHDSVHVYIHYSSNLNSSLYGDVYFFDTESYKVALMEESALIIDERYQFNNQEITEANYNLY